MTTKDIIAFCTLCRTRKYIIDNKCEHCFLPYDKSWRDPNE